MALDLKKSTACVQAEADATLALMSGGKIKAYTVGGGRPATADVGITDQTLLATATLPTPAGTETGGVITAGTITQGVIVAGGPYTADFVRVCKSDDSVIYQGSIGVGTFDCVVGTVTFVGGAYFSPTSLTYTIPKS
jgi:hypothetical protein